MRAAGKSRRATTSEKMVEIHRKIDIVGEESLQRFKTNSTTNCSFSKPIFDYKNLLVNYLPPDMNSTVLRSLFAPHGTVVYSKVVVDHATGISKGYGFVTFKCAKDGIKAQEVLDQYEIGTKTLKVSFSRQQQCGENTKRKTNLYLTNLDPRMQTDDLERHFKTCGYVVQCKVLKNAHGISKQIGFVRYDTAESAQRAIDRFDGRQLEGTDRRIKIEVAGPPRANLDRNASDSSGPAPVNSGSLACYVTGFHVSLPKKVLRKVFVRVGRKKVKSIRIVRRRKSPYAFVNFFNIEDAAEAAYKLNHIKLGNRVLAVRLQP